MSFECKSSISTFKTRNLSEYLRPRETTVLLEPTEVLCRAEDRIRLLIAVHSAPGNAEERRVIRESRESRP